MIFGDVLQMLTQRSEAFHHFSLWDFDISLQGFLLFYQLFFLYLSTRTSLQVSIPYTGAWGAQVRENAGQGQRERNLIERALHIQLRDPLRGHIPPGRGSHPGVTRWGCGGLAGPMRRPALCISTSEHSYSGPTAQERFLGAVDGAAG